MNLHATTAAPHAHATPLFGEPGLPATATQPEKIGQACQEFEAVFLRKILEQVRQPMLKTKDTPGTANNSIYQDMVNYHLAGTISQAGAFGLARSLEAQLGRQLAPRKHDGQDALPAPTTSPIND
jgi:flagellar protein FlgJ